MPTFKSGAFVQQCFSSHPLSLQVRPLVGVDRIVVQCTCCDLRHRVIIGSLTSHKETSGGAAQILKLLAQCAAQHPAEVRISSVNVVGDAVKFRCSMCRREYDATGAQFETYRKS